MKGEAMEVEDQTPERDPNDPVYNIGLPATRLQQAERVRIAMKLLQSELSKARLRRAFRRHTDKVVRQLAKDYPMDRLYQVRPLAPQDITYGGAVCVIASYVGGNVGGMTLIVMYDRPGHKYSDPSIRTLIDPQWIEEISLDEFEEVVKKDNPTVVLA